jgi:hypothetical protein
MVFIKEVKTILSSDINIFADGEQGRAIPGSDLGWNFVNADAGNGKSTKVNWYFSQPNNSQPTGKKVKDLKNMHCVIEQLPESTQWPFFIAYTVDLTRPSYFYKSKLFYGLSGIPSDLDISKKILLFTGEPNAAISPEIPESNRLQLALNPNFSVMTADTEDETLLALSLQTSSNLAESPPGDFGFDCFEMGSTYVDLSQRYLCSTLEENKVYNDDATIYADGEPGEAISGTNLGWSFRNFADKIGDGSSSKSNKINWYNILDPKISLKLKDLKNIYYVVKVQPGSLLAPFVALYTKPKSSPALNKATWYNERYNWIQSSYTVNSTSTNINPDIDRSLPILYYTGMDDPTLHPEITGNNRQQLTLDTSSVGSKLYDGSADNMSTSTSIIMFIAINTDSSTTVTRKYNFLTYDYGFLSKIINQKNICMTRPPQKLDFNRREFYMNLGDRQIETCWKLNAFNGGLKRLWMEITKVGPTNSTSTLQPVKNDGQVNDAYNVKNILGLLSTNNLAKQDNLIRFAPSTTKIEQVDPAETSYTFNELTPGNTYSIKIIGATYDGQIITYTYPTTSAISVTPVKINLKNDFVGGMTVDMSGLDTDFLSSNDSVLLNIFVFTAEGETKNYSVVLGPDSVSEVIDSTYNYKTLGALGALGSPIISQKSSNTFSFGIDGLQQRDVMTMGFTYIQSGRIEQISDTVGAAIENLPTLAPFPKLALKTTIVPATSIEGVLGSSILYSNLPSDVEVYDSDSLFKIEFDLFSKDKIMGVESKVSTSKTFTVSNMKKSQSLGGLGLSQIKNSEPFSITMEQLFPNYSPAMASTWGVEYYILTTVTNAFGSATTDSRRIRPFKISPVTISTAIDDYSCIVTTLPVPELDSSLITKYEKIGSCIISQTSTVKPGANDYTGDTVNTYTDGRTIFGQLDSGSTNKCTTVTSLTLPSDHYFVSVDGLSAVTTPVSITNEIDLITHDHLLPDIISLSKLSATTGDGSLTASWPIDMSGYTPKITAAVFILERMVGSSAVETISTSIPVNSDGTFSDSSSVVRNSAVTVTATTITIIVGTDTHLPLGTWRSKYEYTYELQGGNPQSVETETSNYSNTVVLDEPDAVTNLVATYGDRSVDLAWTAPADSGGYVNNDPYYRIRVYPSANFSTASLFTTPIQTLTSNDPSISVSTLINGKEYIAVVDAAGKSNAANDPHYSPSTNVTFRPSAAPIVLDATASITGSTLTISNVNNNGEFLTEQLFVIALFPDTINGSSVCKVFQLLTNDGSNSLFGGSFLSNHGVFGGDSTGAVTTTNQTITITESSLVGASDVILVAFNKNGANSVANVPVTNANPITITYKFRSSNNTYEQTGPSPQTLGRPDQIAALAGFVYQSSAQTWKNRNGELFDGKSRSTESITVYENGPGPFNP